MSSLLLIDFLWTITFMCKFVSPKRCILTFQDMVMSLTVFDGGQAVPEKCSSKIPLLLLSPFGGCVLSPSLLLPFNHHPTCYMITSHAGSSSGMGKKGHVLLPK